MNRSVINVLIAAGVLSAAAAAGAAPAAADRSGAVGGSDASDTKDDINDDTTPGDIEHPRSPRPGAGGGSAVIVPCRPTWTCPWQQRRRNFNVFIPPTAPALRQFLPVAPVVPAAEPVLDVAALTGGEAPEPVAPAPVAQAVAQSAARPAQFIPVAPAPIRPPVAPAPTRPPAAVASPPPQAPTGTPQPLRVGYPEELRTADLRHVASAALPGLAALAGVTALGGVFGYRQAKAGYVLRTAGAGRFLQ